MNIRPAALPHDASPAVPSTARPCPDWEKDRLATVDPRCWADYRKPKVLFAFGELGSAIRDLDIPHQILGKSDHPADIWIRDWGPVEGTYFRFQPSYAPNVYPKAVVRRARTALSRKLGVSPQGIDLILDGGNLVHNGEIALLTEKVLQDNLKLSRKAVEHQIIALGFERVVFIPVEPDDVIGHADGIVRFIAPDVLLVNDYAGTQLQSYGNQLLARLHDERLGAAIIPFPWFTTDQKRDGIWSAVGCYINFIQMSQGIVSPTFGHACDETAVSILSRFATVQLVRANAIAEFGGVLNCVSLNWRG